MPDTPTASRNPLASTAGRNPDAGAHLAREAETEPFDQLVLVFGPVPSLIGKRLLSGPLGAGQTLELGRLALGDAARETFDRLVSRRHAVLSGSGDGLTVRDVGSKEGTTLQGRRIQPFIPHALATGDVLRLGNTLLMVTREPAQGSEEALPGLVGHSHALCRVRRQVREAARTLATVLVRGETGTGKEPVVQAIFALRQMAGLCSGSLRPLNMASLENLAESELFGYERGAFTGATTAKQGVFEAAGDGMVFLDEIGELGLGLQAMLLRAIQERKVRRVGGTEERAFGAALAFATNRDLAAMVKGGSFREDLYYRIRVVEIRVPPLRERPEDIPALAEHFRERFCHRDRRSFDRFSTSAMERLLAHSWPGNVRELENLVEGLVTTCPLDAGRLLRLTAEADAGLEPALANSAASGAPAPPEHGPAETVASGDRALAAYGEKQRTPEELEALLTRHSGNITAVAGEIGCSRKLVRNMLGRHGLSKPQA